MKRNLLFKAISLLAAILLSQAANSAGNSSVMTISSQIELKNLPDDKVLMKPRRPEVKITVKGPSFLVGPVAAEPPPFRVRVPAAVGSAVAVRFSRDEIALPPSVELLSVEPAEMQLEFETLETKELRVEVPLIGQLPRSLVLERVVVSPATVAVSGPASELRAVRTIESQPLILSEIDSSETRRMELDIRPPAGRITVSSKQVEVSVQLGEVVVQREFTARPVELRSAPDIGAVSIEPKIVRVIVSGPGNVVSAVQPSEILPYVRLASAPLSGGGSELTVKVDPPSKVTVLRVEPSTVRVSRIPAKVQNAAVAKQGRLTPETK
jgi:YbbR domain-containing protein